MRNELKYIEQIEKYLTGAFSPVEKALFEAKMSMSITLSQDVLVHKELMEQIKVNAFTQDVKAFHNQYSKTASGWLTKGFILNCVVGLIVIGISFAGISLLKNQSGNTGSLAEFRKPVSTESQPGGVQAGQTTVALIDSSALKEESVCKKEKRQPFSNATPETDNKSEDLDEMPALPADDTIGSKIAAIPVTRVRSSGPAYLNPYFNTEEVYASTANEIKMKNSGSIIRIPQNSMVDRNGKPVSGKVQIKYREFRDAADMAFSGIPMTFHEDGEDKQMNSLGMFEIRAFQNGEELKIADGKSISVDYVVTEKLDSAYFFTLNDSTQQWTKEHAITPVPYANYQRVQFSYMASNELSGWQKFLNNFRREKRRPSTYLAYGIRYVNFASNDSMASANKELMMQNYAYEKGRGKEKKFEVDSIEMVKYQAQQKKMSANFAANAHIVENLEVSKFGVHNCDQVNKLRNKVEILAKYVDSSGNEIKDMFTLVVIDKNFNNAMAFGPGKFTCNRKGKNMLLLTGGEGRIYAITEKEFKSMNIQKSGNYNFKVNDVTDKIKSRKEFKQFLGLKR